MKLIFTLFLLSIPCALGRLSVSGSHLLYNGERVFLSGVNFVWNNYGHDFGNGWYNNSRAQFENWFKQIESAGGNAVRVWVHTEKSGPYLDGSGHTTGSDVQSYINEIGEFLDSAQKHGIFIVLTIWNGDKSNRCYYDDSALDAYINKFLTPLVKGLKGKPSVIYEIANEVNAVIHVGQSDSNKCYDTTPLANTGEGWSGANYKIRDVQKFINHHSSAIKDVDPQALVTVSTKEMEQSNVCHGCHDYFSDECLRGAGGKQNGIIDLYNMHTYTWNGKYTDYSPMKKVASDYKLNKPIIIGEFSSKRSESQNVVTNYRHAYDGGYAGALAWQYNESDDASDKRETNDKGMSAIKNGGSNGKIRIKI